MRITVVVDNIVPPEASQSFWGEHGAALLIEHADQLLLFDAGQTQASVHNLSLLGIHVQQLHSLILSHGHYDHTGGMVEVLRHRRRPIPVYAHPAVFQQRYAVSAGHRHSVSMPYHKEALAEEGAVWHLSDTPFELLPGLWFSGQIPRTTEFEQLDPHMVTTQDYGLEFQDPVWDEVCLYYAGQEGLTVIAGCAHAGMINSIRYGMQLTGVDKLYGWIGGIQIHRAADKQQDLTIEALWNYDPHFIAASHCTGFDMMCRLRSEFGCRYTPSIVGLSRTVK